MVNTKIETTEVARQPASQVAVRANNYSYAELADIYNQTRVDYIVPMPMNAKRMEAYVTRYDVQLDASFVSLTQTGQPTGIAMMGLRSGRAWVTRLGVMPEGRRLRTGRLLVDYLLAEARVRGAWMGQLEVIVGNTPALRLFETYGFAVTRELLVVRRPPDRHR